MSANNTGKGTLSQGLVIKKKKKKVEVVRLGVVQNVHRETGCFFGGFFF